MTCHDTRELFSALLELEPKTDRVHKALDFARRNLNADLSVEDLAEAANLSPRQFSRVFRAETGQSPHGWLAAQRVTRARRLLDDVYQDTVSTSTNASEYPGVHLAENLLEPDRPDSAR